MGHVRLFTLILLLFCPLVYGFIGDHPSNRGDGFVDPRVAPEINRQGYISFFSRDAFKRYEEQDFTVVVAYPKPHYNLAIGYPFQSSVSVSPARKKNLSYLIKNWTLKDAHGNILKPIVIYPYLTHYPPSVTQEEIGRFALTTEDILNEEVINTGNFEEHFEFYYDIPKSTDILIFEYTIEVFSPSLEKRVFSEKVELHRTTRKVV